MGALREDLANESFAFGLDSLSRSVEAKKKKQKTKHSYRQEQHLPMLLIQKNNKVKCLVAHKSKCFIIPFFDSIH